MFTCSDIGVKNGRQGLDNGWIQFSGIRIPRENMLMKWAKLTPDGHYTPPPSPQIVYATLIGERLGVVQVFHDVISQAVTIAVRYGAVRRQGPKDEQLLDYQSHQFLLMPVVAGVYTVRFTYKYVKIACIINNKI